MLPISLTIKVQYTDWFAIDLVQRSQRRQRQAVVPTQSHQLGLSLAESADGLSAPQVCECLGHLLPCNFIVEGNDRDITTVDDLGPIMVGVDIRPWVEPAERSLSSRCRPNGLWTETST